MFVKEILRDKGHDVHTISINVTLLDVVDELVDFRCGSLVVVDGETMVGVVTERDIVQACAESPVPLAQTPLSHVLNRNLITTSPTANVSDLMGIMTENRVRHIPVLDGDQLVGLVSIGDVVKAHYAELSAENELRREYVQG